MPAEALFCGTDTMTREESYMTVLAHELGHYADPRIMPHRSPYPRTGSQNRRSMSA
jgi:hypothetical protein